eukprot:4063149-Pyramimonas_sp.AAC.2
MVRWSPKSWNACGCASGGTNSHSPATDATLITSTTAVRIRHEVEDNWRWYRHRSPSSCTHLHPQARTV